MIAMHNPPHPGEFIREAHVDPFAIIGRTVARKLEGAASTLNHILEGSGISSEMSLCLSKAPDRSSESWLAMPDHYELWQARSTVNLDAVENSEFDAA